MNQPYLKPDIVNYYSEQAGYTWRPLAMLNLFRLIISGAFTLMYYTDRVYPPLASHDPNLFSTVSVFYFLASLAFMMIIRLRRPAFDKQVFMQIITDILMITLMIHASGGINSGLGNLLIIAIAGGSIVIRGRHSLMYASIASLAVLSEQVYSAAEGIQDTSDILRAGILGLTFFATAIITRLVARYVRENEALAQKHSVDLANMSQLTEHIIQRMQTGIVVIDPSKQIHLMNESAWHMLQKPSFINNPRLASVSPELDTALRKWQDDPESEPQKILAGPDHPAVIPRFARLGQASPSPVLIYLEDASSMSREAQQMQLASLGRLTASIAHEIRNPLAAISHAGQLLAESPNIDEHDTRLTRIIGDHSRRMNEIIESIMYLGRRDRSHPELFQLKQYLEKFLNEFCVAHNVKRQSFDCRVNDEEISVRFDTTHLNQILSNLCENALRYTPEDQPDPKIELVGGILEDTHRPFLDIIDHGSGIDRETAGHIFEPFFTTRETGTGLGLFISRELAECNQAHLQYHPAATEGSRFRITFQDPRRLMH